MGMGFGDWTMKLTILFAIALLFARPSFARNQDDTDRVNPDVKIAINPPTYLVSNFLVRQTQFSYLEAKRIHKLSYVDRDMWEKLTAIEKDLLPTLATSEESYESTKFQFDLANLNVQKSGFAEDEAKATLDRYLLYRQMNTGKVKVDLVAFYALLESSYRAQCAQQDIDEKIATLSLQYFRNRHMRGERLWRVNAMSKVEYLQRKLEFDEAAMELPMRQDMVRTCFDGIPSWDDVIKIGSGS